MVESYLKESEEAGNTKAAQINKYGGSEVVEINKDAPKPTLSAGKILIEMYAAGVNPVDWKIREGYMRQMAIQFPMTLGGDFSGAVSDIGTGVTGFKMWTFPKRSAIAMKSKCWEN